MAWEKISDTHERERVPTLGWRVRPINTAAGEFIPDPTGSWSLSPIVVPPVIVPPVVVPPVVVPPIVTPPANPKYPGLFTAGDKIRDSNGEIFVMHGMNATFAWGWKEHNFAAIKEIAKTGANTIRCVFSTEAGTNGFNTAAELDSVVTECIKYKMVPVLGNWEGTGKTTAAELAKCFDYWLEPGRLAVLRKHEKHIVLNPANEWGDFNDPLFVSAYSAGINRLRAVGVNCLLQIDASGAFGQNPRSILNAGPSILIADPNHNVQFSLHCYAYHRTSDKATDVGKWNDAGLGTPWLTMTEVKAIQAKGLALVIGEIAHESFEPVQYNSKLLLTELKAAGIGWLVWGWNQNSPSAPDMTTPPGQYLYNSDDDLTVGGKMFITDPEVGLKTVGKPKTDW